MQKGKTIPRNEEKTARIKERIREMQTAIDVLEKLADNPELSERYATAEAGIDYRRYRKYVYDENWLATKTDSGHGYKTIDTKLMLTWQERMWISIWHLHQSDITTLPINLSEEIDAVLNWMLSVNDIGGFWTHSRMAKLLLMWYRDGYLVDQIGKEFGTTSVRVRQILHKAECIVRRQLPIEKVDDDKFINLRQASIDLHEENVKRLKAALLFINLEAADKLKRREGVDLTTVGIDQLGFSKRTHNCLKKAGVTTVAAFLEMTDDDFAKIRGLGQKSKSMAEIRMKLTELSLLTY